MAVVDGLKGFPEAHYGNLPTNGGAGLRGSSHPAFAEFRVLEGPQAAHAGIAGDLSGQQRRRWAQGYSLRSLFNS